MNARYPWQGGPEGFAAHETPAGPACVYVYLVWTTRRQTPFLAGEGVHAVLEAALGEAAAEVGSRVEHVQTGAAWVAVTVRVGLDVTLRELVWRLKRRSAERLVGSFPEVARVQGAWTRRTLVATSNPWEPEALASVAEAYAKAEKGKRRTSSSGTS